MITPEAITSESLDRESLLIVKTVILVFHLFSYPVYPIYPVKLAFI